MLKFLIIYGIFIGSDGLLSLLREPSFADFLDVENRQIPLRKEPSLSDLSNKVEKRKGEKVESKNDFEFPNHPEKDEKMQNMEHFVKVAKKDFEFTHPHKDTAKPYMIAPRPKLAAGMKEALLKKYIDDDELE